MTASRKLFQCALALTAGFTALAIDEHIASGPSLTTARR